jgi:hypothetical protein
LTNQIDEYKAANIKLAAQVMELEEFVESVKNRPYGKANCNYFNDAYCYAGEGSKVGCAICFSNKAQALMAKGEVK